MSQSLETRGCGNSWMVVGPDGKRVGRPYNSKFNADSAAIRLFELSNKRSPRPCITCRLTFNSEGPHNRMCNDCRRKTEGMI